MEIEPQRLVMNKMIKLDRVNFFLFIYFCTIDLNFWILRDVFGDNQAIFIKIIIQYNIWKIFFKLYLLDNHFSYDYNFFYLFFSRGKGLKTRKIEVFYSRSHLDPVVCCEHVWVQFFRRELISHGMFSFGAQLKMEKKVK